MKTSYKILTIVLIIGFSVLSFKIGQEDRQKKIEGRAGVILSQSTDEEISNIEKIIFGESQL